MTPDPETSSPHPLVRPYVKWYEKIKNTLDKSLATRRGTAATEAAERLQCLNNSPNARTAIEMNVLAASQPLKRFDGVLHKKLFLLTPELKIFAEIYIPNTEYSKQFSRPGSRRRMEYIRYISGKIAEIKRMANGEIDYGGRPKIKIHFENTPPLEEIRPRFSGERVSIIDKPTFEPGLIESAWNRANLESPDHEGRKRLEVFKEAFLKTIKEMPFYKSFTPEAQREIEEITIYGQPVPESRWKMETPSPVGARGVIQIMPSTAAGLARNRKYAQLIPAEYELTNVEHSGIFSAIHHDDVYSYLNSQGDFDSVARKFELDPASSEFQTDFVIPCIVIAYNTGKGNVSNMLKWFINNIEKEDVERKLGPGPYGKDLFWFMSHNYYKLESAYKYVGPDRGHIRHNGFGRDGNNYYFASMAARDLMMKKEEGPRNPIVEALGSFMTAPIPMLMALLEKIPRARFHKEFLRRTRRGTEYRHGLYEMNGRKAAVMGSSTAVGISLYTEKTDTAAIGGLNPWQLEERLFEEVFPEMEKRGINPPNTVFIFGTALNGITGLRDQDPDIVEYIFIKYKELAENLKEKGVERVIFATLQPYEDKEPRKNVYNEILEFNNKLRAEARTNPDFEIFEIYAHISRKEAEDIKNSGNLHLPNNITRRIANIIDQISRGERKLKPIKIKEPPVPDPEPEPEPEPAPEVEPAVNGEICEPPELQPSPQPPPAPQPRQGIKQGALDIGKGLVGAGPKPYTDIEKIEPSMVTATLVILQDDISLHPPVGWEASVATSESSPGVYVYTVTFTNSSTGKTAKMDISELLKDPVTPGSYELKAPISE